MSQPRVKCAAFTRDSFFFFVAVAIGSIPSVSFRPPKRQNLADLGGRRAQVLALKELQVLPQPPARPRVDIRAVFPRMVQAEHRHARQVIGPEPGPLVAL